MKDFNTSGDDGLVDALLAEVAGLLERLIVHREEGTIDLLGLPLSPASLAMLEQRLGHGEVDVRINACGLSEIHETRFPGVWWTQHADEDGRVVARLIEVAFVPNILRADVEDMKRGWQGLFASISASRMVSKKADGKDGGSAQ
jgi:hydrogenase-1 operon protein HyaF